MLRPILLVWALLLCAPATAAAQAIKGDLSIGLRSSYQTARGVWHGSELVTGIPAQSVNTALYGEYAPIDKLALGLGLNLNGARYTGPQTIPGNSTIILAHGSQDDGSFHWNITDLDFEARYEAYDGAVSLAPVLRVRVPLTDYENKGYAAAGSHLAEVGAGFQLTKFGLGSERLILQLGYTFTFVQKEDGGGAATEEFRVNRSDADLTLAFIITEKIAASAGMQFRYTHDGFDLEDYPALTDTDPLKEWHDPVLQVKYLAPTASLSFQATPAWSIAAMFATSVWGRNASAAMTFGLGVSWSNNVLGE
jgi:hypothetical protein